MTRKPKHDPDNATHQMVEMMSQWQAMGLGAMNNMGAGFFERMNEMGAEWLRFVSDRVQQDVEFQQKLLTSKSPQDVQAVQSEFFQQAVDDYTAETGKILSMSNTLFETPEE